MNRVALTLEVDGVLLTAAVLPSAPAYQAAFQGEEWQGTQLAPQDHVEATLNALASAFPALRTAHAALLAQVQLSWYDSIKAQLESVAPDGRPA